MDLELTGRVAFVQAASRGLGFAVARELSLEGASVAICSRSEERVEEAAGRIREESGRPVQALVADVTDQTAVRRAVGAVVEEFGGLHILVCNAGGPPRKGFELTTAQEWQDALQANFLSAVESCRAALPSMRAAGHGRIVLITSLAVKQPIEGLILSNAARAGATGFAKSLSNELAGEGITVNCLCPGLTRTERLEELIRPLVEGGISEEEALRRLAGGVPMGRVGTPREFAAAAAFLCSGRASYITGVSLLVDGGACRHLF